METKTIKKATTNSPELTSLNFRCPECSALNVINLKGEINPDQMWVIPCESCHKEISIVRKGHTKTLIVEKIEDDNS